MNRSTVALPGSTHTRAFTLTLALAAASVLPNHARAQQDPPPADAAAAAAPAQAQEARARAKRLQESGDLAGARKAIEAAIEADPDEATSHDLLREVVWRQGRESADRAKALREELVQQYQRWLERHPQSSGIEYGLGAVFSSQEDPRAKPHLLAAVRLQPKLAKAWEMLSSDAERWGDQKAAREAMHRAALAEPESADYAFYYASGLQHVDRNEWVAASLDVAKRFPTSERGAQALYWLGERAETDADRIKYWEQARAAFPAAKFRWTRSAMSELFDTYLRHESAKALALAEDMSAPGNGGEESNGRGGDAWPKRRALAQDYLEAVKLVGAGEFAKAAAVAKRITIERRSSSAALLALLKAEIAAGTGDVQGAYDSLVERLVPTPEDGVRTALLAYGEKLGKTPAQVDAEVRARREAQAKAAPPFTLQRYGEEGTASLADYRGKVVLLTFWFPGCGPCRGEFPHFEHVLAKFDRKQVAYVGVNVLPEQDDYVLPFMAGTKYTFTPLHGDAAISKPDAYAVRGCPSNFLIDGDGKIVYRGFMIHGENEILLQRMIESLLPSESAAAK